jgi:hypothetical protein
MMRGFVWKEGLQVEYKRDVVVNLRIYSAVVE